MDLKNYINMLILLIGYFAVIRQKIVKVKKKSIKVGGRERKETECVVTVARWLKKFCGIVRKQKTRIEKADLSIAFAVDIYPFIYL